VIIFASYGVIPGSITGYYYGRTVQAWSAVAERERHLTIFMRVLRHNFRNEMNVLLGELGLAAETAEGPTATHVENAASRGRDLMSTVEKQRCLVEIVADPAQPQVHDLSTVLDSAVERVSGEYPAAEVTSEDPGDTRILAHPQIERAITELLENAIVHSTAAPPRAVVEFARASECAVLSIHDSGARIPPEETSILTAETDPTQLEHGSGLGLWIVNRLVTQSNGSFHVEDDDSAGNTVVVRLPLADAESGKTGRLSSRPGTGR
jgi:signal transduction histidine kinase